MIKKYAVPSGPEYDDNEWDYEASKAAQNRRINRKMPTSLTLPPEVVDELKELAEKKGIPYQVLMRSFILEGLERMKKSS